MSGDSHIRDAVQALAGTKLTDQVNIIACTVESVDEDAMTCNVVSIGGNAISGIPDVKLMATVDDGLLMIPAIDSMVLVVITKRGVKYVAMFSELQKVVFNVGSSAIEMKDGAFTLNDGSFGGLIKIEELVKKLNNLENAHNDLAQKFNAHTHILALTAGTGTAAVPANPTDKLIQPVTQKSDIENDTITHGK